jgi:beta-galactosidase/beta-glucuronidase
VSGGSIYVGNAELRLHGVSYVAEREHATFAGARRDFASMSASGINALRTTCIPEPWLLDLAQAHGIYVLAGVPWQDHMSFLDRRGSRQIVAETRAAVRALAGHPALLGYAVGDEVPSAVVRWYGKTRVERFIGRLSRAVKREDPAALVTHVHYPSTEYLHLPFIDFCCFNVFLEHPTAYEGQLVRLQDVAAGRPLVLTELGVETRSTRFAGQAVESKVRKTLARHTAGAFVFGRFEWERVAEQIGHWDVEDPGSLSSEERVLLAATG